MFKVIHELGAVLHEGETCTAGMQWLIAKANEYEQSHIRWYEPDEGEQQGTVITLQVGNQFYKLTKGV